MSIVTGVLNSSTDYGLAAIRDLLTGTGLFTVVSDTGTGTSRVVWLTYLDNPHRIRLYYAGSIVYMDIYKLDNVTTLVSGNGAAGCGSSPTYKLLVNGNRMALLVNGVLLVAGTQSVEATPLNILIAVNPATGMVKTFYGADDAIHNLNSNVLIKKGAGLELITQPIFSENAAGTHYFIAPLSYTYVLANLDGWPDSTVVTMGGEQYLVLWTVYSTYKMLMKG